MSMYTQRFLELVETTGLLERLPGREPEIARAMRVSTDQLHRWLHGAPMQEADLAAFEKALPSLTRDLAAPPATEEPVSAEKPA